MALQRPSSAINACDSAAKKIALQNARKAVGQKSLLSVKSEHSRSGLRLLLYGELDMSSVGELNNYLKTAETAGYKKITVDLKGLEFMDSTGLGALIEASKRAEGDGWTLRIVNAVGSAHRVFEITGLEGLLDE